MSKYAGHISRSLNHGLSSTSLTKSRIMLRTRAAAGGSAAGGLAGSSVAARTKGAAAVLSRNARRSRRMYQRYPNGGSRLAARGWRARDTGELRLASPRADEDGPGNAAANG